MGHVVYKEGMLANPTKITVIVDLAAPMIVKRLRETLVHARYYQKFIREYTKITMPMEKLLKTDAKFEWNDEC